MGDLEKAHLPPLKKKETHSAPLLVLKFVIRAWSGHLCGFLRTYKLKGQQRTDFFISNVQSSVWTEWQCRGKKEKEKKL